MAHYCSPVGDQILIEQDQMFKIDIKIHLDGYIAGTSVTICLDSILTHMVKAAEEALASAIKIVKIGRASDIGATIQHTIKKVVSSPSGTSVATRCPVI